MPLTLTLPRGPTLTPTLALTLTHVRRWRALLSLTLGVILISSETSPAAPLTVPPPPPPPLAVPQLGPCASSGHAWRPWAVRYSQGEAGPLGAQQMPRLLERAASKAADSTAFDIQAQRA